MLYLLMALFQINDLLSQRLDLALHLHAVKVCVIDDLAQVGNILLYALPHDLFRISPAERARDVTTGL